MTNMQFPFGDAAGLIQSLLAGHSYEAVANHRGQCYYQGETTWDDRQVYCRIGVVGLDHLPDDLYEEVWSGYYDCNEPDSMLFDEVHANIFACIKKIHRQGAT